MRKSKQNIVWINKSLIKPKQVKKDLLDEYLIKGWKKGRGPKENW